MQDKQDAVSPVTPTTAEPPVATVEPTPTSTSTPTPTSTPAPTVAPADSGGVRVPGWVLALLVVLAGGGAVGSGLLWQRLGQLQTDVARRSADSNTQSIEARALSQQAQTLSLDSAARLGVLENQVKDLGLQRAQLESLVNQISRAQDSNLLAEVNASVRLAQQQMGLTGSTEAVIAALTQARLRLEQAGGPHLGELQRAIAADIARLQSADVIDAAGIQKRMDDMLLWVDDLPLLNNVVDMRRADARQGGAAAGTGADASTGAGAQGWPDWAAWWHAVWSDVRQLVRVTRLDQPDAALIAPDQAYFLRENIKLRLLHARLELAARQYGQVRLELGGVADSLGRYFDPASRLTQQMQAALKQMQAEVRDVQPPSIDETLSALSAAQHP